MKKLTLLIVLLLAAPLTSFAWDRQGHQAVSAIAYAQLSQSERDSVDAILKWHPWSQTWRGEYKKSHPGGMTFENFAFIRAAAWPDDIRGNEKYHHATWHYVNFPVTLPDEVDTDSPIGTGVLMKKIDDCMDTVKKAVTAPSQRRNRAIMLSWLLHLVGDLHQPLHSVALVNSTYPKGDHGGNDFFVRKSKGSPVIKLHAFWDDILGTSRTVNGASTLAGQLTSQFPSGGMTGGDYQDWAKECTQLGLNDAYQFQGQAVQGSSNPNKGTALPSGYAANAKQIAAKQVARGGYRLAEVIRQLI